MRGLAIAAAVVGLLFSVPSHAAKGDTDMAKVTCAEAAADGPEGLVFMMFWIDGYLSAEEGDTTMTESWLAELGKAVEAACSAHPERPMLDVVKEITQ